MSDSINLVIKKIHNYINNVDLNEIRDEINVSKETKERDLEFMRIESEFRQFLLESCAD